MHDDSIEWEDLEPLPFSEPVTVSKTRIKKAIRSFKRGTSGGICKISADLLKFLVKSTRGVQCLVDIVEVILNQTIFRLNWSAETDFYWIGASAFSCQSVALDPCSKAEVSGDWWN